MWRSQQEKCAVACLRFARFRQKERRTEVRLLVVLVCFRVWRTLLPEAVRHSAGWACPTAALFSDALIESRIGRTTNSAMATTMKFMTAATANTAYQLPV